MEEEAIENKNKKMIVDVFFGSKNRKQCPSRGNGLRHPLVSDAVAEKRIIILELNYYLMIVLRSGEEATASKNRTTGQDRNRVAGFSKALLLSQKF